MQFNYRPTLRDDKVTLRPLDHADFRDLFAIASDPLIWEQHPASDRYQEPVFRRFFKEALDSSGALIARDADTGRMIGSSRFHGYDPQTNEVEIGWTFLARTHWGGNYNGSMKRLMLGHAFQVVDRVIFMVGQQNIRSQRAVEKIGVKRQGVSLDAYGNESYRYEIDRDDFRST